MTQLAVFGDSWPYGAELSANEKTFGELLHQKLNTKKFINCSQEGTSIEHLIIQLKNFIDTIDQDTICIFFITNPIRFMYWRDDRWKTIRPTGHKKEYIRSYYHFIQSDTLDNHKANTSVLALQRMCQSCEKISGHFYIEGWSSIQWTYPGIDKQILFPKTVIDIFNGSTINLQQPDSKESNSITNYLKKFFNKFKTNVNIQPQPIVDKNSQDQVKVDVNTRMNELMKSNQKNPFIFPNKCHPNQKGHQLIADELYKFIK